jgi:hypothetical protein
VGDGVWNINPISGSSNRLTSTGPALYVSASGSNSNDGLTVATPLADIQTAYDTLVSKYDCAGQTPQINLADGTYTSGLIATTMPIGAPQVRIIGNTTTPANCLISITGNNCIQSGDAAGNVAHLFVDGVKMSTTTSGHCFELHYASSIRQGSNIDFGACAGSHVYHHTGGYWCHTAPGYTVSGGAVAHISAGVCSVAIAHGTQLSFPNAISFSQAFLAPNNGGTILFDGNTYVNKSNVSALSWSASLSNGGILATGQSTQSYLPGGGVITDGTGITDINIPWSTYTPTMTSGGGSLTAVASLSGAYFLNSNRVCTFRATGTITTNGTGASYIVLTLPVTSKSGVSQFVVGREIGVTNKTLSASIHGGNTNGVVLFYDGTYPGANGAVIAISGQYEAA